jgi:hypothetical protein
MVAKLLEGQELPFELASDGATCTGYANRQNYGHGRAGKRSTPMVTELGEGLEPKRDSR